MMLPQLVSAPEIALYRKVWWCRAQAVVSAPAIVVYRKVWWCRAQAVVSAFVWCSCLCSCVVLLSCFGELFRCSGDAGSPSPFFRNKAC